MAIDALSLLDQYIAAVRTCPESAEGYHDRNNCLERLSAADSMRLDLKNGDVGRAYSVLTDEARYFGWGSFHGKGSDAAVDAFLRYAGALKD